MALIGDFNHRDGNSYVMVVNRDFIHPATLKVKFRQAPGELLQISRRNGREQATASHSQTGELKISLAAGDAES